ncbi:MAG: hypothetical protein Q8R43_00715, partial [Alphaproteobacteria bacterium]|nr:hypothetical protein [Alphaproteobacteria bacterium]
SPNICLLRPLLLPYQRPLAYVSPEILGNILIPLRYDFCVYICSSFLEGLRAIQYPPKVTTRLSAQ